MKIKALLCSAVAAIATGAMSLSSTAATVSVEITNLTQGIYFTPLLVTAHNSESHLFQVGMAASTELRAMAEGGDISGLVTMATGLGAVSAENPAEGMLAPAMTTMVMDMDTGDNNYLSIVAMILPTNDGFVGLDAWPIPSEAGSYTLTLNAYDAGTEANNELVVEGSGTPGVAGIPANPGDNGGTGGTGVTTMEENMMIHIHRGNLGDADPEGGVSDLTNSVHRWLNPVAKVVVTVE